MNNEHDPWAHLPLMERPEVVFMTDQVREYLKEHPRYFVYSQGFFAGMSYGADLAWVWEAAHLAHEYAQEQAPADPGMWDGQVAIWREIIERWGGEQS